MAISEASIRIFLHNKNKANFSSALNHGSEMGKTNFLEKSMWPEITYNTLQVARFSSNPKCFHRESVVKLEKYLRSTITGGINLIPYKKFIQHIFWHRFLRKLSQGDDRNLLQHYQIILWIRSDILRMPNFMYIHTIYSYMFI